MNARIQKEIRLLLPAWIVAVLLAIAPLMFVPSDAFIRDTWDSAAVALATFAFGIGMLLLNLSSFGREFSGGTFSILLAQPWPRHRIWNMKSGLLAVAAFLVLLLQILAYCSRAPTFPSLGVLVQLLTIWGLIGLVAYSGALWTTLLLRQVTAAFWFILFIPAALALIVFSVLKNFSDSTQGMVFADMLIVYSTVGWLWARRQFLRAQDVQWTGGIISFGARRRSRTAAEAAVGPAKRRPLRALIAKELQSHHVSLFFGGVLLLLHTAGIVARKMMYETFRDSPLYQVLGFSWFLWLALAWMIGGTAVAEERRLGTWESQLCLPAGRSMQMTVKFVVALVLGIWLGGVTPWVIESIATWAGFPGEFPSVTKPSFWSGLAIFVLISTGLTLVSFYASTLTRHLLQSLGAAVVIGLALLAAGTWALSQSEGSAPFWRGPLVFYLGAPSLAAVLACLAFQNSRLLQIDGKSWLRNALVLMFAMLLIASATALIWNRAWELVIKLEPRHGPAQMTGSVRPRICGQFSRTLVLLPDGRLWTAKSFRIQELNEYEIYQNRDGQEQRTKRRIPVPASGTFIGGSNWLDLASTHSEAAAIRSDGTLWQISYPRPTLTIPATPTLERIGTESDWKNISAGYGYFLALKQDGTVWGWGRNSNGQLGIGPEQIAEPVRIGNDSGWVAAFASRFTRISIGVKTDGTVWRWGNPDESPNSRAKRPDHGVPRRWNLNGTEWRWLASDGFVYIGLKRDGTLWASDIISQRLTGQIPKAGKPGFQLLDTLVRVGRDADWLEASYGSLLLGLKTNGTFVANQPYGAHPYFWGNSWKPSKYSDWIGIGEVGWGELGVLAADGTLCAWENPASELHRSSVLGPTRRPLWSINILQATE